MKKIDPKIELEDIEQMIYETLNLSKTEWFTSLAKREKLHSVENMQIDIKNSKTGRTLTFAFKNNYLIAPQLTQTQQTLLYQKYLEKVAPEEAKKTKEEARKKVEPLESYISFLSYHDLIDSENACIVPVAHEMLKNLFGKTIKIIPKNKLIDYTSIKPGDLCTIQNDVVLGEFSFAKNRPALILNVDLDNKKVLICFLTTSESDSVKDKSSLIALNKENFYPEFAKKTEKDSYIKCSTYSEISIDRIIDKVGEVKSKEEFSDYALKIYKYVSAKLKEGIKNFVEETQSIVKSEKDKIVQKQTEISNYDSKSQSLKITPKTSIENKNQLQFFKPLSDQEIEKIFRTYFLDSYGEIKLDFSKFDLSKCIDEVKYKILQYLTNSQKLFKIANSKDSVSLNEVIDAKGQAKQNCYVLKINENVKDQKNFPYKEYVINAFNVKRKAINLTHDKILTSILNSVCQAIDSSYFMHYAGFIVIMAKKGHLSEEQLKENLQSAGIIYKGRIEDIFKLDLEFFKNIYCDSEYYNYQSTNDEK